jgi:CheY-like chemotaxis protein
MNPEDTHDWQILVVDDSREVADIVQHLLTAVGAQVFIATTGAETYKLLDEVDPTLILLDLSLPDTDGFTILDTVRDKYNPSVPVVAFTGRTRGEAQALIDRGFNGYVLKPFKMDSFIHELKNILADMR